MSGKKEEDGVLVPPVALPLLLLPVPSSVCVLLLCGSITVYMSPASLCICMCYMRLCFVSFLSSCTDDLPYHLYVHLSWEKVKHCSTMTCCSFLIFHCCTNSVLLPVFLLSHR